MYLILISCNALFLILSPAVHHSFNFIVKSDTGAVDLDSSASPALYSTEALENFLAQITARDAPDHDLHLKVGAVDVQSVFAKRIG
jgi:hypothetical protein